MPRTTRSSSSSSSSRGASGDVSSSTRRQSARLQERNTSEADPSVDQHDDEPASSSTQGRPPRAPLADISSDRTRRRKRRTNQREEESQTAAKKKKSRGETWDDCSTDVDEEHPEASSVQPAPADAAATISTVTPASATHSSRLDLPTEPQELQLDREQPGEQKPSSSASSSSRTTSSSRDAKQVLPEGVVDLYPTKPTATVCMCGQDHCSAESLTNAYLQAYGKEYYEHLRSSEHHAQVLPDGASSSFGEASDESRHSTGSSSSGGSSRHMIIRPAIEDYPGRLWPVLGSANHQDEDMIESLDQKPHLTPKMRAILIDWLIELSDEYKVTPLTLQSAVALVDSSLANPHFHVEREMLQCLGCACMWIAAKMEEVDQHTVHDFVYISDNSYTPKQIATMEMNVCTSLQFRLSFVTPYQYVHEYLRASYACNNTTCCQATMSRAYQQLKFMTLYLIELGLLPYEFVQLPRSLVAAAAVYLARATLGVYAPPAQAALNSPKGMWTKTLQHYTGYNVMQLEETVLTLHRYQRAAEESHLKSVFTKYKQNKYLNVALKTALLESDLGL